MGHRLADVHLAGFAPAFTLSLCDSEYARKPPVPIASVVRCHSEKLKDRDLFAEKSLTNCPLFDMKRLFGFDRLLTSDSFFGRTIPRRLSKERFWFSRFRQWLIKTETWKLRLDNFSVFSDFFCLRAEVTLEKETPEFRKVQVRAEVKLLNFVEDDFYEFWLNSVAILSEFCFERIFTIICWETYSLRTENLKLLR